MYRKNIELAVGTFVLGGIIAIAYLAISIGGARIFGTDTYTLRARFADVGGLASGADVKIAGVPVGRVTQVQLNEDDFVAMVTFKVDKAVVLDDDTIASVKTNGLIGDKFLGLLPGGSGIPLEHGEVIIDTESAVDFEGLISEFAFGSVEE